jgi:hypothetical protein
MCRNLYGNGGQYAKLNKPTDWKTSIAYSLSFVYTEKSILQKKGMGVVVTIK